MENLQIYNALRAVPKEAQKSFNNGRFSGTDINPMWRIKKLTEHFGPCGIGWYWGEPKFTETTQGTTTTIHCTVALYIKDGDKWSEPIFGVGGNTLASTNKNGVLNVSDEAYKMAYTDAQSNASKQLGLGADIWFEKDQTKYTKDSQSEPQPSTPTPAPQTIDELGKTLKTAIEEVNKCKNVTELQGVWNKYPILQKNESFKKEVTSKKKQL